MRMEENSMERVYNFSPGPSVLPEPVLREAAGEMLDWRGSGMSVMEMSHRSKPFAAIMEETEALLREVMGIPDSHDVLFLQGGASLQFAMVPYNLMPEGGSADYLDTGAFARKAIEEGQLFGTVRIAASSKAENYSRIPEISGLDPKAAYVHLTTNNTIYGTRFREMPETGAVPLVADMSSNILSEPVDVSRFGLIYAGAQKNLGPAGLTLVIIRKDLIGRHRKNTPTMLRYDIHAREGSLYNTPPAWSVYVTGLMLRWVRDSGGVPAMAERNRRKADLLYRFLDGSALFRGTARKEDRSLMNIPFVTGDEKRDAAFLARAADAGLVNLKGHRSVGGMRASIYNAMPEDGVRRLVETMARFEEET